MANMIELYLDGDNCWPDLTDRREEIVYVRDKVIGIALLENGTAAGKHSVAFRFDLPDGRVAIVETGHAALSGAVQALGAIGKEA